MRTDTSNRRRPICLRRLAVVMLAWCHPAVAAQKDLDFNRDIRPILSDHCYACHGPDENKRKAGLRGGRPEEGVNTLKSGNRAVVPGLAEKGSLVRRWASGAPDE